MEDAVKRGGKRMLKKVWKGLCCILLAMTMITPIQITETHAAGDPNWGASYYNGDNPFSWGQCTWYVFGRTLEVTGIRIANRYSQWYNYGTKSSRPASNSIIMLNGNAGFHTAYVENVSGNSMTYSEANNTYYGTGAQKYYKTTVNIDAYLNERRSYGYSSIEFIQLPYQPAPDATWIVPTVNMNQETGVVNVTWPAVSYAKTYFIKIDDSYNNQILQAEAPSRTLTTTLKNKGLYSVFISANSDTGYSFSQKVDFHYRGMPSNQGNNRIVKIRNDYRNCYLYYDSANDMVISKYYSNAEQEQRKYLFKMLKQSDGSYMFQSMYNPAKYLSIQDHHSVDSLIVNLNYKNDDEPQSFWVIPSEFGGYTINRKGTSQVFDKGVGLGKELYIGTHVAIDNQNQYFTFEDANIPPTSVLLDVNSKTILLGKSFQAKASVDPFYANPNITWRTGNSKVATVDKNGKVTAKGVGSTWLYAKTSNGKEAKCLVKVINPATSISFNVKSRTMSKGSQYQFKATIKPSNTTSTVTWRTGNSKVATVDKNGKVTAKGVGSTWLYAKTSNGLEAKVLIKVIPAATSVKINYTSKSIKKGSTYTFKATVNPSKASQAVTWRTGNSKVATVDKNGKVTAKGVGSTWLYAKTWNGKEAKCLIKVTNPATSISLNAKSRTMSKGSQYQFKATIKPSNTTSTVAWRTGNGKVATVDKNGKVTAKGVGSTWLYAKTSNGLEAKVLIKVIPAATSVKINYTSKSIKKGSTYTFKATVNPSKASQAVTWRTGNSKVATVDKNGKVTAKGVGSTWLYAKTWNGKEAKCLIRVYK